MITKQQSILYEDQRTVTQEITAGFIQANVTAIKQCM